MQFKKIQLKFKIKTKKVIYSQLQKFVKRQENISKIPRGGRTQNRAKLLKTRKKGNPVDLSSSLISPRANFNHTACAHMRVHRVEEVRRTPGQCKKIEVQLGRRPSRSQEGAREWRTHHVHHTRATVRCMAQRGPPKIAWAMADLCSCS